MAAGTLISRLTGFGRIVALGYALDFARLSDTYTLANNVPNIVYELVIGGVLAATLVPVFVNAFMTEAEDQQREAECWQGVSALFTLAVVVMALLAVLLALVAPLIIDLYTLGNREVDAEDQRSLATMLLRLFAVQVVVYGFMSVATALLHAHRRFALPAYAPVANNVVVIAVLLALPHVARDLSLPAVRDNGGAVVLLGLGTTAGVCAMGAVLVPPIRRLAAGRLRWHWRPRHPTVAAVVRLSGWTLGYVIANQVALWVTIALANQREGGVTALLSAYTFFILPHGIIAVSIISALQPELAEHWAAPRMQSFRASAATGFRLVLFAMLPAACLLAVAAGPLVDLVLHHGRFTQQSAELTAGALQWLAVGLPGFSAFVHATRVLQATQQTRSVFWLAVLQNGVNVALAWPAWMLAEVNGLAGAHSISYTLAAIAGLLVVRRRSGSLPGGLARSTARSATASTVTLIAAVVALRIAGDGIAGIAIAGVSGVIAYLAVAVALGSPEMRELGLRRRLGVGLTNVPEQTGNP